MLAQNVAVQGADAAQPSAGTPPPKPEEKKEGEKSDKAEKKDDSEDEDHNTSTSTLKPPWLPRATPVFRPSTPARTA